MAVISSSTGDNLDDYFWLPFSKTAKHLGMEYLGNMHTISGEKNEIKINDFIKLVDK